MSEILLDEKGEEVDTRMEAPIRIAMRYYAKDSNGTVKVLVLDFPNGQIPSQELMRDQLHDAGMEVRNAGLSPLTKPEFWNHLCTAIFGVKMSIVGSVEWEPRP